MTGWLSSNLSAVLATIEVVGLVTALVLVLMLVDRLLRRDRRGMG